MKVKKYVHGVTFFVSAEMLKLLKKVSDQKEISLSELLREIIDQYLVKRVEER